MGGEDRKIKANRLVVRLGIHHLQGSFLLLGIGWVASVTLLLIEKITHPYRS